MFYCSIVHYLKDFIKLKRLVFIKNNQTNFLTNKLSFKILKITTVVIFLENVLNVLWAYLQILFSKVENSAEPKPC